MSENQPPLVNGLHNADKKYGPVLVIHGGAGIFDKSKYVIHEIPSLKADSMSLRSNPGQWEMYKAALRAALLAGHAVLEQGGSSVEASVAAVVSMEDCPLFNCAKGAVFNTAGKVRQYLRCIRYD